MTFTALGELGATSLVAIKNLYENPRRFIDSQRRFIGRGKIYDLLRLIRSSNFNQVQELVRTALNKKDKEPQTLIMGLYIMEKLIQIVDPRKSGE